MPVKFKATVKGAKEIKGLFNSIPGRLQKSALRTALVAGARVIRDEAKSLAPIQKKKAYILKPGNRRKTRVKGGLLKKRIQVQRRRGTRNVARVSVISRAPHSHLVEFGTSERFHKSGKSTGIMPKQPFMLPALENKDRDAVREVATRLRVWIKTMKGKGRF